VDKEFIRNILIEAKDNRDAAEALGISLYRLE
jgi:hypothetical protein